jgi:hypothetical protein
MPYTGLICEQSGIYRGDCYGSREIALSRGDKFPPCSGCRDAVNWRLVRPTQPTREGYGTACPL